MEVKDKLGTPIVAGCYIVYGHALGRCAGLRIGRVISVRPGKKTYSQDSNYRIVVRGVDDDWRYGKMDLTERKGTLLFGNRIIVLDESKVPESYKELLATIKIES